MTRYSPPANINIPWKALVLKRDPDYEREKRDQLEYQFSNGREFRANPDNRGAYAED
jgi:hypothetical protein